MKKKNIAMTGNFIVMVLLILGVAAYYILKWAFKLLCLITAVIVKAVGNAVKKHRRKKAEKDITDVPFVDTELNIEETSTAPAEVSREKLGLFDKRIYDGLFRPLIRERGEAYCSDGKIRDLKKTGTHYSCIVKGTADYNVELSFGDNDKIASMSCTCPYYTERKQNCKHIYALLYKVKCGENKQKIIAEINRQIKGCKTMIKNAECYLEKNKQHFPSSTVKEFKRYSRLYSLNVQDYEKIRFWNLSEEILLRRLNSLSAVSFELRQKIKSTLSEEIAESDTVAPEACELSENRDGLMTGMASLMVFDELMTDCSDEKDNSYDEKLEAEMNSYCLEDWQKDLVRNGSYDVWNFDEEELEEDDYYFEDDDYYSEDDE